MEFDDDMIDEMLENGYIEEVSRTKSGEPLYKLTKKFYDKYQDFVKDIRLRESDAFNSLWFKDYIDVRMDEDGTAMIYLTKKSDSWYTTDELTSDEKSMMYIIYSTGSFNDQTGRGY